MLPVSLVILLLLMLLVLFLIYRDYIYIWIYSKPCLRNLCCDPEDNFDKKFDVFISYSHDDKVPFRCYVSTCIAHYLISLTNFSQKLGVFHQNKRISFSTLHFDEKKIIKDLNMTATIELNSARRKLQNALSDNHKTYFTHLRNWFRKRHYSYIT